MLRLGCRIKSSFRTLNGSLEVFGDHIQGSVFHAEYLSERESISLAGKRIYGVTH